jgi:hypothetical protein
MNKEEKLHKAIEKLLGPKIFLLGCDVCGYEYEIESYNELTFSGIQYHCTKCGNFTVFLKGRIVSEKDLI